MQIGGIEITNTAYNGKPIPQKTGQQGQTSVRNSQRYRTPSRDRGNQQRYRTPSRDRGQQERFRTPSPVGRGYDTSRDKGNQQGNRATSGDRDRRQSRPRTALEQYHSNVQMTEGDKKEQMRKMQIKQDIEQRAKIEADFVQELMTLRQNKNTHDTSKN